MTTAAQNGCPHTESGEWREKQGEPAGNVLATELKGTIGQQNQRVQKATPGYVGIGTRIVERARSNRVLARISD